MASRDYTRHTVSSTAPAIARVGDEYYNPTTNTLYKSVAYNGTTVQWEAIPMSPNGVDHTISGNLITANGVFWSNGVSALSNYGNTQVLANLAATGNPVTIGSNLTVGNIVAASINNTIIGNTTPVAGTFTTGTFSTLVVNSSSIGLGSRTSPGSGGVSIGYNTSNNGQGAQGIAIGYNISQAGTQGQNSIAIGPNAGGYYQTGQNAVAIGYNAGYNQTASNAIAIGYNAGYNQTTNSTILNATGNQLNDNGLAGFFVAPVRNDATKPNIGNVVVYNTTTNEFTYSNTIAIAGTANVGNLITTSGVFWANGAAYSSGSGSTYGNVQMLANLAATGNPITIGSNLTVGGNLSVSGNVTNITEATVTNGSSGSTFTLSLANGTFQTITWTANCTVTMPAVTSGKSFTLLANTGTPGPYITTTFTGVRWPGGTAPTITATANKADVFSFISDGAYWYGFYNQNY